MTNTPTHNASNNQSSVPRRNAVRQKGSSTPASIAEAIEAGMRAARRPSAGTRPRMIINAAATRKMAVAVGQVMPGGVAANNAAPGVDQASTTGMRVFNESAMP